MLILILDPLYGYILSKDEQIVLLQEDNLELKDENAQLKQQVAWLKKQLFGNGKSEKLDKNQTLLELALAEEELNEEEEPVETITYQRKKSKNGVGISYSPLKVAGRFSRNAVVPSLKSAVLVQAAKLLASVW